MIINGNRLEHWGCCLESGGDDFLRPHPIKPFPRNSNRLEHGVEVLRDAPRLDSKEFTLVFAFGSGGDVIKRVHDFVKDICKGGNMMVYKGYRAIVDYISSTEFQSLNDVAKISIRFECSNPFEAGKYGDYNEDYSKDYLIDEE